MRSTAPRNGRAVSNQPCRSSFFGNLDAWLKSPVRVLTVGLNPSQHEFPEHEPCHRFPLADGPCGRTPSRYLEAMSACFRTHPCRGWFSSFERLLNGMDASYHEDRRSTALHKACHGTRGGTLMRDSPQQEPLPTHGDSHVVLHAAHRSIRQGALRVGSRLDRRHQSTILNRRKACLRSSPGGTG